jgi:hypothetical protein
MKFIGVTIIFISLFLIGRQYFHHSGGPPYHSPIISNWAPFIDLKVNVRAVSMKEVYADLTYTNKSDDSVMLYKVLFPFNNVIREDVFSIFENEDFEQVKYVGPRVEKRLKLARDDDEGAVVPVLVKENFFTFLPGDSLKFSVNIAGAYDFYSVRRRKSFSFVPSILMPVVSTGYKQVYGLDTIHNVQEPVYYIITMPEKRSVDSMRVKFSIPQTNR